MAAAADSALAGGPCQTSQAPHACLLLACRARSGLLHGGAWQAMTAPGPGLTRKLQPVLACTAQQQALQTALEQQPKPSGIPPSQRQTGTAPACPGIRPACVGPVSVSNLSGACVSKSKGALSCGTSGHTSSSAALRPSPFVCDTSQAEVMWQAGPRAVGSSCGRPAPVLLLRRIHGVSGTPAHSDGSQLHGRRSLPDVSMKVLGLLRQQQRGLSRSGSREQARLAGSLQPAHSLPALPRQASPRSCSSMISDPLSTSGSAFKRMLTRTDSTLEVIAQMRRLALSSTLRVSPAASSNTVEQVTIVQKQAPGLSTSLPNVVAAEVPRGSRPSPVYQQASSSCHVSDPPGLLVGAALRCSTAAVHTTVCEGGPVATGLTSPAGTALPLLAPARYAGVAVECAELSRDVLPAVHRSSASRMIASRNPVMLDIVGTMITGTPVR